MRSKVSFLILLQAPYRNLQKNTMCFFQNLLLAENFFQLLLKQIFICFFHLLPFSAYLFNSIF